MNLHALSKDFEKIITSPSLQLRCFLIGLNESVCQALLNRVFFLKNSKYFKSYHGKTRILKFCPFFENLFFCHHAITSNKKNN